jgi:hypothetical protein
MIESLLALFFFACGGGKPSALLQRFALTFRRTVSRLTIVLARQELRYLS